MLFDVSVVNFVVLFNKLLHNVTTRWFPYVSSKLLEFWTGFPDEGSLFQLLLY